MRYEKSERVQHEDYCCIPCLLKDVLETLYDENLENDQVHIIADTYLTEAIFKILCQIKIDDFEFDMVVVNFDKEDFDVDEYCITILDDGEVFVEKAIDRNANYFEHDGFIFAESEVSEDAYSGINRNCDVMVFTVDCD